MFGEWRKQKNRESINKCAGVLLEVAVASVLPVGLQYRLTLDHIAVYGKSARNLKGNFKYRNHFVKYAMYHNATSPFNDACRYYGLLACRGGLHARQHSARGIICRDNMGSSDRVGSAVPKSATTV